MELPTAFKAMETSTKIEIVKPKVGFMDIPLEIRIMIYKLLVKEMQPLTGPRYIHEKQTMPEGVLGPYCSAEQLEKWIEDKKTLESILCTIRRCSKQMSRELAEYITYPRLGLCIVIDYNVKPMLSEAIADCLQDSFAPEHTVAVALYCKCLKGYLGCRHRTKNDKMFGDKRPKFPKVRHLLDRIISRVWAPPAMDQVLFAKGMGELQQFVKLEWLHISVNHGDLKEWFTNPVEDFKALVPWIKKGVLVTVAVDYDKDIVGATHDVYHKTVECLENGAGEVVMEKYEREKYGLKLVLRGTK